jgi:hypothetical protein
MHVFVTEHTAIGRDVGATHEIHPRVVINRGRSRSERIGADFLRIVVRLERAMRMLRCLCLVAEDHSILRSRGNPVISYSRRYYCNANLRRVSGLKIICTAVG